MPRFFVCLVISPTMALTSSFSLTNPGESADHSRKCSGIGEPEVVAHVALAAVPDLGEVLHLLRVGLLHVGRVQDDERVLADSPGAL